MMWNRILHSDVNPLISEALPQSAARLGGCEQVREREQTCLADFLAFADDSKAHDIMPHNRTVSSFRRRYERAVRSGPDLNNPALRNVDLGAIQKGEFNHMILERMVNSE